MEDRILEICDVIKKFGATFDLSDPKVLRAILGAKDRISPFYIKSLNKNEIFVFGSDTEGTHDGRASEVAYEYFGAIWGQGFGLQGKSYAIPTTRQKETLDLAEIEVYVQAFLEEAKNSPEKKFYVTRIGCGYSGYQDEEVAPLFKDALVLDNVYLPQLFIDMLFDNDVAFDNPSQMIPTPSHGVERFSKDLTSQFGQYYLWLRKRGICNKFLDSLSVADSVEKICCGILRAVDMSFRGLPASAYKELASVLDRELLHKPNDTAAIIGWQPAFKRVRANQSFYRMRNEPDNLIKKQVSRKGMFHIGFSLRGNVKTQRYSVPGYPCLYLGEHIFGCWEESGRPNLSNCLISRLKNVKEFEVLDLRIPEESAWESQDENNLRMTILTFPFVIASTFVQSDPKASFKPEYIVPQLLLQYVKELAYEKNQDRDDEDRIVYGIRYTSVHKPKAGEKKPNYCCNTDNAYNNYVIPVVDIRHEYCSRLVGMFKISEPICEEFEKGKKPISGPEMDETVFEMLENVLADDSLLDFLS